MKPVEGRKVNGFNLVLHLIVVRDDETDLRTSHSDGGERLLILR